MHGFYFNSEYIGMSQTPGMVQFLRKVNKAFAEEAGLNVDKGAGYGLPAVSTRQLARHIELDNNVVVQGCVL